MILNTFRQKWLKLFSQPKQVNHTSLEEITTTIMSVTTTQDPEVLASKIEVLEAKLETAAARLEGATAETERKQQIITDLHLANNDLRAEIERLKSWQQAAIDAYNIPNS